MKTFNFTKGRYFVGFDLGGTLVDESAPQLHPLPIDFISQIGIDEKTLSQFLLYSIDQLMIENQRIADEQMPAHQILEKAITKFKFNVPIELLETAAWHLLGGATTNYLKPLPNAIEILKDLKENGATIVALSNTAMPLAVLSNIFKVHSINEFFHSVILSSECGWRKPCEKAFEQMEHSIGYTTEDYMIFIGNNYEADILPAINRGYETVYIGNNNLALNSNPKPSIIVERIEELINLMPHKRNGL